MRDRETDDGHPPGDPKNRCAGAAVTRVGTGRRETAPWTGPGLALLSGAREHREGGRRSGSVWANAPGGEGRGCVWEEPRKVGVTGA